MSVVGMVIGVQLNAVPVASKHIFTNDYHELIVTTGTGEMQQMLHLCNSAYCLPIDLGRQLVSVRKRRALAWHMDVPTFSKTISL